MVGSRPIEAQPWIRLATIAGAFVGAAAGSLSGRGASGIAVGVVTGALAVAASCFDVRERRIPNRVVLAGAAAGLVLAVATMAGSAAAAGAVTAGGPLLAIHLARPAGVGFGDVKLAVVLGLLLGTLHWPLASVALAAATLLGLGGAALRPSWRHSVPFGACLGAASLITIVLTPVIGAWLGLW